MNGTTFYRFGLILFFAITLLLSCSTEPEPVNSLIGSWEWSSGSRVISPQGFERLHRDRSENYLVGDAEFTYDFNADGSFESKYKIPDRPESIFQGTWREENNTMFFSYTQPADFTGITEYRIPFKDDDNLDLQWSVQYPEFDDAQVEVWKNDGSITSEGWFINKDSLLNTSLATDITSTITLHFLKVIE